MSVNDPDSTRQFPFGWFESFAVGDQLIGRAIYQPGWRWSEHIAPTVGSPWCEVEHLGVVLRGRIAVQTRDGVEVNMGPRDMFSIPAGHDSWVLGDEEYESLHLLGVKDYVMPAAVVAAGE